MITLPSRLQIEDKATVTFPQNGSFQAVVIGIHFYTGKVKYDLEVRFEENRATRVYNVDSAFVEPAKAIHPIFENILKPFMP